MDLRYAKVGDSVLIQQFSDLTRFKRKVIEVNKTSIAVDDGFGWWFYKDTGEDSIYTSKITKLIPENRWVNSTDMNPDPEIDKEVLVYYKSLLDEPFMRGITHTKDVIDRPEIYIFWQYLPKPPINRW